MTRTGIYDAPGPLHIRQERYDDTVVVIASGEIDLCSVARLRTPLAALLERCSRLVLDLRQVEFIDSSGLHCLLDIDRASRCADVEFALVAGPPEVQRIFQVTGTEEQLRFIPPIELRGP